MQEKIFYLALFQKPKQQKKCIWRTSIYYNWQNWFSKIAWSMKFKQFCSNESCYSHEYLLHSNKSTHFFTHTARHFWCLINICIHIYISKSTCIYISTIYFINANILERSYFTHRYIPLHLSMSYIIISMNVEL